MESMFPAADANALFGAAVLSGRTRVLVVTGLAAGVRLWSLAPSAGVIPFTPGIPLLLGAGRRHRRRTRLAAAGARSGLLRDALARRVRGLAVPVLA